MSDRVFHPAPTASAAPAVAALHPAPLDEAAYHGLAGRIVRKIAPHTESDPAALLLQLLVALGNCIGRGPRFTVEMTPHFTNEFCVIVGQSAKARKGTSYKWIVTLLEMADADWRAKCQAHGLVSGEGIIHHVRDDMPGKIEGEIIPGVADKRLLIVEEEFGGALTSSARKDNTLTSILRCAWDGNDLRTLAKNSHEIATAPHVSVIGHITHDELKAKLRGDLVTNGFANRFLWVYAQRARLLPHGGTLHLHDLQEEGRALREALAAARALGEITFEAASRDLWCAEYQRLSGERPGIVGAVTSRLEAHAIRLSLLYAALDGLPAIRPEHLRAAFAICEYAQRSAEFGFGGLSADARAILEALRTRAPEPLGRRDICRWVFGNHAVVRTVEAALSELEAGCYAIRQTEPTAGPPRELWQIAQGSAERLLAHP